MTENQLRFFAKTPTIIRPNQVPLVGREAVADFYEDVFSSVKILENSYSDLVVVIQGDTATRRYVGTGVFVTADIAEPQTTVNQMVDVLVKENGEWRTLVHSWVPSSN